MNVLIIIGTLGFIFLACVETYLNARTSRLHAGPEPMIDEHRKEFREIYQPLKKEQSILELVPLDEQVIQLSKVEAEQVDLNSEALDFVSSFQSKFREDTSTLNSVTDDCSNRGMSEMESLLELIPPQDEDHAPLHHLDVLQLSDVEENKDKKIQSSFFSYADCKIADNVIGKQKWIVQIIGYEQNYIHVSDVSSRKWVKLETEYNEKCCKGDTVEVYVDRSETGQIDILNMVILESNVTKEYVIWNECNTYDNYSSKMNLQEVI